MGDEKILPPPPPPPVTGDVEALGPRTSRGRPTLPGGIGVTMDAPPTPPPVARRTSRPPPLPPAGLAPSPFPRAPSAPAFDAGAPFEDSRDEGAPVPNTLPSASLDPNSLSAQLAPDGIPVVVMPTISVGDAPLPPPAILQEGLAGPEGDAPPTSSRPPTSIAPAMPQIPKPVSYRPAALAPGIVSDHSSDIGATQAIPLTTPARSSFKGLILVTVAAAVIGGGMALAVLLSLRSKTPETAAAPAATEEPSTSAAPAGAAPATAAPATAAPSTTAAPAPSPVEPSSPASAVVSAPPSGAASPSRTGGKPASGSTAPRPSRKSDRIED